MIALLWVGLAAACEGGPAVTAAMDRAQWLGWAGAALNLLIAGGATAWVRRRGLGLRPVVGLWALALGHPGIWQSAYAGDCGRTRLEGSLLFGASALFVLAWTLLRPRPADQPSS